MTETKLIKLCRAGDYDGIIEYLDNNPGIDVTADDGNGMQPLIIIAADEKYGARKLDCVKKLFQMGAGDSLSHETGIAVLGNILGNFNKYKTRENASTLYNAPENAYYVSAETLLIEAMKKNHSSKCFLCHKNKGENYFVTPLKAAKENNLGIKTLKYDPVFFNACKKCLDEAAKMQHMIKLVLTIFFSAVAVAALSFSILGYDIIPGVKNMIEIMAFTGAAVVFFLLSVRRKGTRKKLAERLFFEEHLKPKGYTHFSTEKGE